MMYNVKTKYTPDYLRELSPQELKFLAGEANNAFYVLRCQTSIGGHSGGRLVEKTHLFKKIRRDIARIKTIIRESNPAHHSSLF